MADFAQGGFIPRSPLAGDSRPIPVRRGCVFVPANVVKRYGAEFLAALNGSADSEVVAVHE